MEELFNTKIFPLCCELTDNKEFYIKDNGCCSIVESNVDSHVIIKNPKEEEITFLKIDQCILHEADGEKCDCSVSNSTKIYFIEIKEIHFTNNSSKRRNKRRKARSQLANTINYFKSKYGPKLNLRNVHGIISLIPKMEVNFTQPIMIKDQVTISNFLIECGCPNINEGNEISF